MVNDDALIRLLADLITIDSVNPAYPGGVGEAAVADYVEAFGRRLGLVVERQPVLPGRDNVLLSLTVPNARGTLLFEAHMDTVSHDGMGEQALRPAVRDGRLYGRGACDTKGSLAAMLAAMARLAARQAELAVNVQLLAAVDEEYQYRGIAHFCTADPPVTAAIVGEPTELQPVIAHKGCVRWRMTTHGRAAHSSRPEEGDNAIVHMTAVIQALQALGSALAARRHSLVGSPTLSIGRIWGGTGVNIVPDRCTIEIDRRTIPGEDPAGALAEIDDCLAALQATQPGLRLEREAPFIVDWALATPPDAAIVAAVIAAARTLGTPATPIGVAYGTDASKLWALAGVPSIVLGPGSIAQAHTADEYVPLADLTTATALYTQAALNLSAMS
ncbi:MAG: M20 family metallopeptidase [Chloroflexi bacterium]|nr:M20 family metallopeptidase [Chloroflexota bacterium]